MSGEQRYLIVNADDFGQSAAVNEGILEAHDHGIVTSASLMTRRRAAAEAAACAAKRPRLSLGLHLDPGEWAWRSGRWVPTYTVVPLDDKAAVEDEVERQYEAFRRLVGKDPSHINSHQHVHMREPVRSVALELSRRLGAPLRCLCPAIHYFTRFYGQTAEGAPLPEMISAGRLIASLAALPAGWTVLICHPGYPDDTETPYRTERLAELRVLRDPRVKAAIAELRIALCSFDDWRRLEACPARAAEAADGELPREHRSAEPRGAGKLSPSS